MYGNFFILKIILDYFVELNYFVYEYDKLKFLVLGEFIIIKREFVFNMVNLKWEF